MEPEKISSTDDALASAAVKEPDIDR